MQVLNFECFFLAKIGFFGSLSKIKPKDQAFPPIQWFIPVGMSCLLVLRNLSGF